MPGRTNSVNPISSKANQSLLQGRTYRRGCFAASRFDLPEPRRVVSRPSSSLQVPFMLIAITWMLLGFVALIGGGEVLVRGASRLASMAGISPLVIGLTVVAFGTSSPELAVSVKANLIGEADVAVGNVVGSNIFNVLLVLGISATVAPLLVASQLIRFDVPIMIGASILMLIFGWDGDIVRTEGLILFAGLLLYLGRSVLQSRKENAEVREEFEQDYRDRPPRTWDCPRQG